jgi:hypothetical protein
MDNPLRKLTPDGGTADADRFNLKITEVITFKAINADVENRGVSDADQLNPESQLDQVINGLSYHQEVIAHVPPNNEHLKQFGGLIHVEDGQILFNSQPGIDQTWDVARQAVIPHGNALQARGLTQNTTAGEVNAEVNRFDSPWDLEAFNLGDFASPAAYSFCHGDPTKCQIYWYFAQELPPADTEMQTLEFRTSSSKDIVNLPNEVAQVEPEAFNATFYLWEEKGEENNVVDRLQYIQNVRLRFVNHNAGICKGLEGPDIPLRCRIQWNHVIFDTLERA